jgi:hypothetical protein
MSLYLYTGMKDLVSRQDVGDTVLKFHYRLDTPVREDLYQYLTLDNIPTDTK